MIECLWDLSMILCYVLWDVAVFNFWMVNSPDLLKCGIQMLKCCVLHGAGSYSQLSAVLRHYH
jgi:hypothetical protein